MLIVIIIIIIIIVIIIIIIIIGSPPPYHYSYPTAESLSTIPEDGRCIAPLDCHGHTLQQVLVRQWV